MVSRKPRSTTQVADRVEERGLGDLAGGQSQKSYIQVSKRTKTLRARADSMKVILDVRLGYDPRLVKGFNDVLR